jgi:integrase
MPRPRSSKFESASARLHLPIRKKPYAGPALARGIKLLYRRNRTNGTWIVQYATGTGRYKTKRVAVADDFEKTDSKAVLDFYAASDAAKRVARGGAGLDQEVTTVAVAVDHYRTHLEQQDGDPYNAERIRRHLPPSLLTRPIALLTGKELGQWRDGLEAKGLSRASVNRIRTCLRAALTLAAKKDRIAERSAWEDLESLADATAARNVILDDTTVRAFIAQAYQHDRALGMLVDTLAVSGARPSQIVRLQVADLDLTDTSAPRLLMPKSAKGGTRKRAERKLERTPVPITVTLAALLKQASKGRAPEAPLLTRRDGTPWGYRRNTHYRRALRDVVTAIGLDPDTTTAYSLRHSSIVRMLLHNLPIRIVASLHDTSVQQIEKHYSRFIAHHSDQIARRALLQPEPSTADKVVALKS